MIFRRFCIYDPFLDEHAGNAIRIVHTDFCDVPSVQVRRKLVNQYFQSEDVLKKSISYSDLKKRHCPFSGIVINQV